MRDETCHVRFSFNLNLKGRSKLTRFSTEALKPVYPEDRRPPKHEGLHTLPQDLIRAPRAQAAKTLVSPKLYVNLILS